MKFSILLLCFICIFNKSYSNLSNCSNKKLDVATIKRLKLYTLEARSFCIKHHYNTTVFFLADMSLHSGKKRFFILNMRNGEIIQSALVAHGCCNYNFLAFAQFSNKKGCGCSSYGKYKIGNKYNGNYGFAYRLTGLDSSNSNAAERNIVLHSYYTVPDTEIFPNAIGNSYGCPMVSKSFLKILEKEIDNSVKPILLWIVKD